MPKMLFIAPNFYSYHVFMKEAFENKGYEVDYFDDRPSTGFWDKAFLRLNKKILKRKISKYFDKILNSAKDKQYDVVLCIYGQSFTKEMFSKLRNAIPNAHFIFYMYDPLASMPDRLEIAKMFDKAYSFDNDDVKEHSDVFELLPVMFCYKNFEKRNPKYDFSFATTIMPGKYKLSKEIIEQLKEKNYKVYEFKFIQSKLVLMYYKSKNKEFKKAKFKEFVYKRMSYEDSLKLIEDSNVVIDIPKLHQSGLTMKTFDCLAAEKKLITTNESIKEYDFYKPENIYIYKDKFDFDDVFFKSDYVPVPEEIKEKYSLESWAKKILSTYEGR